ncbi:ShlB/FhaC/HecB family hemolysin secretion/activation protein (plasmid) [Nostoc sp. C052]|nr:ShlB/FhaC/HecB family hemolysin secretion/activation protein [Nostoc sp. C052]
MAFSLTIDPAFAQILTPGQILEQFPAPQPPQITPPFLQKKEPIIKPTSPPSLPLEIPVENQVIIKVGHFIFKGNTVFTTQELEAVVAPYVGREIIFSKLAEAGNAVTNFYVEHGYIRSGAFFPVDENQRIQLHGGIVTIQVVEGELEKINISGSSRLDNYIRERLPSTGKVLNINRLADALQLLQTNPLIESITAELRKGSQIDKSVLNIKVKANQAFKIETILDNSRSPTVGTFERGVGFTNANLLGLGDSLSIGYRNTNGSNTITTSYSLPINVKNGTIEFAYANSSSKIIEQPFNSLDILSDIRAYKVTFRQPLIQKASATSTQEFALGLTADRLESESSLLNTPFPLEAGADSKGRTRISSIRFFQEWIERNTKSALSLRSQFSLGIGAFNATINNSSPDSRFFSWRGQASWARRLSSSTNLLLRADIQLADRPLVPLEQFGLGGADTVRAYRKDNYLTDNGSSLSAEIHISTWKDKTGEFQVIPFLDIGTSWNNHTARPNDTSGSNGTLASVGLGISYDLGDHLNAQIDWGIPLISIANNSNSNTWQENGLYFYINYHLF